ncbi:MAG: T9SS type A sorting domain-containing protein, partial [Bacteroidetes bacterium]|nr:T9SS type A sorting domain-containing protein [Bacteroidota bacterium]
SIQNNGQQTLTSVTVTYGFDGNLNQIYNWTGNLPQWQSTVITLPTAVLTAGNHTFGASISNPNAGQTDENTTNNSVNSSFNVVIGGQAVQLNLSLDCYGSETTWELQDETSTAIYSGSGYEDDEPGLVTQDPWCLNDGCYTYYIMDSYGDGMDGGFWCQEDGSVSIVFDGEVLAEILESEADFGDQTSLQFCIGVSGVEWFINKGFEVYPNPFTSFIQVNLNELAVSELVLLDIAGKEVLRKAVEGNKVQLELGDGLSSGTYLIQVKMKDGSIKTKKVNKV